MEENKVKIKEKTNLIDTFTVLYVLCIFFLLGSAIFPYYWYNWGSRTKYYSWMSNPPIEVHYGLEVFIYGAYFGIIFMIISLIRVRSFKFRSAFVLGLIGISSISVSFIRVIIIVMFTHRCYFKEAFYLGVICWIGLILITLNLARYWNEELKPEDEIVVRQIKEGKQEKVEAKKIRFCTHCNQYCTPEKKYSVATIILLILCIPCVGWGILAIYLIGKKPNRCPFCKQKGYLRKIELQEWQSYKNQLTGKPIIPTQKELKCSECGALNHEKDSFCTTCGKKLEKRYCHNCGTPFQAGQEICQKCGVSLTEIE